MRIPGEVWTQFAKSLVICSSLLSQPWGAHDHPMRVKLRPDDIGPLLLVFD